MQLLNHVNTSITGTHQQNHDHIRTAYCYGNFDGASVILEASPDGTEWFELSRFNKRGVIAIGLRASYLRGRVESAGGVTDVSLLLR